MKILFEDGVYEEVRGTEVSPGIVRLDETPLASSADLRFGDVIEIEADAAGVSRFVRLRTRSELTCVSLIVGQEIAESRELRSALVAVSAIGVHWEQAYGGVLLLHGSPEQLAAARARLAPLVTGDLQ